jgi:CRISPR/Cas system-associated exonuclease Cas4 (RecB family)
MTSSAAYAAAHSLKERFLVLQEAFEVSLRSHGSQTPTPRDREFSMSDEMVGKYRRALIAIARHYLVGSDSVSVSTSGSGLAHAWTVMHEIRVKDTHSGLFGVIDRIERTSEGLLITDFKSTARSDVPERYSNQVKLYSALWFTQNGVWPTRGVLHYLLTDAKHEIQILPNECLTLLRDARRLPAIYASPVSAWSLATPGDVCKLCDYRPWCEPFWSHRRTQDTSSGLLSNFLNKGIEGRVTQIERNEKLAAIQIHWAKRLAWLHVPIDLFPHVIQIETGMFVKALDTQVSGQSGMPVIKLGRNSELYFSD